MGDWLDSFQRHAFPLLQENAKSEVPGSGTKDQRQSSANGFLEEIPDRAEQVHPLRKCLCGCTYAPSRRRLLASVFARP